MKKNKCLVMISTYNGEKYLPELLDSVINQENVDINILIRDDGSKDNTIHIINSYLDKYTNIKFYTGDNLGYAKSFWNLLKSSGEYDYYAFCDQDDIWHSEKIYRAINLIEENCLSNNIPALYTSNVIPVNNKFEKLKDRDFPDKRVLNVYESLQKSILPGCTFVFNNNAKNILIKYNGYMESHDWAVYNIINIYGKVIYDNNSYIYYRIHENNAIGNDGKKEMFFLKIRRFFKSSPCTRSRFAKDLYDCYCKELPLAYKKDIEELGYYRENIKLKLKLLFNKNFKGKIFKIYILLNRV